MINIVVVGIKINHGLDITHFENGSQNSNLLFLLGSILK